jgi:hypothetical protein
MAKQSASRGGSTQNEYSRKIGLVQQVLGDPSLYPDEFKSWIVRWLYGNVNLSVVQGQLPAIEKAHLVGASGEVAFGGTWVNFGSTFEPALYWKDYLGYVHLGGLVKSGTIGTTIFTLPAGYRPQYALTFAVYSNNAFGYCQVNPDGTVVASGGSNVSFSLSGIMFRQYA